MKKVILGFVIGVVMCVGFQVFADSINVFKAERATFEVYVKDQKFESDKPIVAIDGSTYLPLKDIGTTLGVPVEWNSNERRVEIAMKDGFEKRKDMQVKSNTLKINYDNTISPVVVKENKYYLRPTILFNYLNIDGNDFYLELPNKEPVLFQSNNKVTECAIKVEDQTFIDIEACGIKYTVEEDTLWIE